ncbi:hypothetical protein FY528_20330 [Hymenobacter lutimineralis]|uniref:Uncharacterized protein n=1 Tax=Hymenobacter lutimineralis TaxID=2606448 RepID=A0A5D6UU77_9BACT|nr:hypothetical protein [Hymenobacter lutimineralis]TYZ05899.1 hypothetical protein FY528_20330 [Hymenobacter lutimineralis]
MNAKILKQLLLLFAVILPLRSNAFTEWRQSLLGSAADIVVVKNRIWVLNNGGQITVYTTDGAKVQMASLRGIQAQLIAQAGDDIVAQTGQQLQLWSSKDSTWRVVGKLAVNAYALAVTSRNHIFAITNKGVLDVVMGQTHLPDSSPNNQLRELKELGKPSACFLDKDDNIWLGFGYGEWGGNIFAYDTQHQKFTDLKFNSFNITLHPIKSFFQLPFSIGTSSGLQHMSNSGAVAEFRNQSAQLLYSSWNDRDTSATSQPSFRSNAPYVGPAAYDAGTNTIYVYSNLGVYKGSYGTNLSRFTSWKKVFHPKLHWRNGQPDAVGSPMNVLKLLSLGNGKLVLLTQNDGVGIWDGQAFKLL